MRRVLDDAASALTHTNRVVSDTGYDVAGLSEASDDDERDDVLGEAFEAASVALQELESLAGRLKIRFGSEHDLVTIYESAAELALKLVYTLALVRQADDERDAAIKNQEKVEKLIRQFRLASESFTLTAYRVAGVKLRAVELSDL